jgi:hypothetical protein
VNGERTKRRRREGGKGCEWTRKAVLVFQQLFKRMGKRASCSW